MDAPTGSPPAAPARLDPDRLLASLNDAQRAAVEAPWGPVLVLAGPGSGKTRVLTHRIAWLVGVLGVPPWQILAVTFTNKAAREMRGRIEALLGEEAAGRLTLGTFHGVCAAFLRREAGRAHEAGRVPFDQGFAIFDADDQLALVKRAIAELDIDDKQYRARAVLGAISAAKNEMLRPAEYRPPTYWHEVAARVWTRYEQLLQASNALDFDDLLVQTAALLQADRELLERYRARWQWLLVDEFQDTNSVQYALLKLLAAVDVPDAPHNLFVVGDEDQSIYRWRGADWRNIERFRRDFPAATVVLLERNYRSTQVILDAARAVIDRNRHRTPKALWTEREGGARLTLFEAYDEAEEAAWVAAQIARLVEQGERGGDIAVMYRTNAQSRALEDALVRRRIPYRLIGATRFYDRREVRDALAYLRLAHNPRDEVSLARVINVPPRGIGPKAWASLGAVAREHGEGLVDALRRIAEDDAGEVDARSRRALAAFHALHADLVAQRESVAPSLLLDHALAASGYAQWLRDGTEEGEDRWANLLELVSVAADFDGYPPREGLAAMLESVALVADVDALGDESADERVTLLTLHSAKGLEFPTVFLTGLEEGTLPHMRSGDDPDAMEEERRLLYVGLTRAERRLFLVHAFRRAFMGSSEPRERSRFLDDIPLSALAESAGRSAARARETSWRTGDTTWRPATEPSSPAAAAGADVLRPGQKVRHATFGAGVVVAAVARGDDQEVTVAFAGGGVRKLLQSFARLERA